MVRRGAAITAAVWLCALLVALVHPVDRAHAGAEELSSPPPNSSDEPEEEEDEEEDELRQRLTEREDKRRPVKPWSTEVAGRPLIISGEYEVSLDFLRRRVLGELADQPDRLFLEQGLDLDVFYSWGEPLSLFAQARVAMEEDLLSDTFDEVSDLFVERGEMWLYSENIAGSHLNLDLGRLDFEDERRWWWDDELDAVRVAYETETTEVTIALARELGPCRSDRSFVEPERDRVLRVIGEASWDWSPNHALELFALYQDDHSRTERPGHVVHREREDESDARLGWIGARLMGVFDLRTRGILGYWLDTALVRGEERLVEFEDLSSSRSLAEEVIRRDVRGWAVDAGLNWILPVALEPRLFAGYAFGSGDREPEEGTDRSFRQTALHGNEAGFGGVERFAHYGVILDPELSNLHVFTVGAGLSLLRSSSLDLVYHHYRLAEPASFLRDAGVEATLTGEHRDLGHGLDLVLALEEWERFELEVIGSVFLPGRAFGRDRGEWSYGGLVALRYAF